VADTYVAEAASSVAAVEVRVRAGPGEFAQQETLSVVLVEGATDDSRPTADAVAAALEDPSGLNFALALLAVQQRSKDEDGAEFCASLLEAVGASNASATDTLVRASGVVGVARGANASNATTTFVSTAAAVMLSSLDALLDGPATVKTTSYNAVLSDVLSLWQTPELSSNLCALLEAEELSYYCEVAGANDQRRRLLATGGGYNVTIVLTPKDTTETEPLPAAHVAAWLAEALGYTHMYQHQNVSLLDDSVEMVSLEMQSATIKVTTSTIVLAALDDLIGVAINGEQSFEARSNVSASLGAAVASLSTLLVQGLEVGQTVRVSSGELEIEVAKDSAAAFGGATFGSENGTGGAVTLPASLFAGSDEVISATFFSTTHNIYATEPQPVPGSPAGAAVPAPPGSGTVGLTFLGVEVADLPEPIAITMQVRGSGSTNASFFTECSYWDPILQRAATDGCELASINGERAECR
jgi:hypothetical protein